MKELSVHSKQASEQASKQESERAMCVYIHMLPMPCPTYCLLTMHMPWSSPCHVPGQQPMLSWPFVLRGAPLPLRCPSNPWVGEPARKGAKEWGSERPQGGPSGGRLQKETWSGG